MIVHLRTIGTVLGVLSCGGVQAQALTDEQRREVQQLVEASKATITAEIWREVCAELLVDARAVPRCVVQEVQAGEAASAPGPDVSAPVAPKFSSMVAASATYERQNYFRQVGFANLGSDVDAAPNRFELTATNAQSRAGVRVNHTSSSKTNEVGHFRTLSATLSAPVNKDDDRTDLWTHDGLTNGTELALRASWLRLSGLHSPSDPAGAMLTDEARALLEEAGLPEPAPGTATGLTPMYNFLKGHNRLDLYPRFERLFFVEPTRYVYGVSAKIGHETFKYMPVNTLASGETTERPWSVGLFGGVFPARTTNLYVGGSLDYQDTWKAANSRTVCPAEGSAVLECVTGAYGAPVRRERLLGAVEARRRFGPVGAILKLSHDFRESTSAAELPLFLVNGGGFSAGFRLGWDTEEDFDFGLFVSSEFSLESR